MTEAAFCIYAYPWDLVGDPGAIELLRSMDVDRVVLASAYHSVRAGTPRHPLHKVIDARWAAVYPPFRDEAFAKLPIAPRAPGDWVARDAFASGKRLLDDAGMDVGGWLALTHLDGETTSSEFRVVNAFGDVYGYALCPSHDAVVDYAAAVVHETVLSSEVSSVVIEAWSQLGVAHGSEHDKTAAAGWSDVDHQLLSICFCVACTRAYQAGGCDVGAFRAAVRGAVGFAHAGSVRDEWAEVVLGARALGRRRMLSALRPAALDAGATRVELHADDDPWGTGPSGPLPVDHESAIVAPAWRLDAKTIDRIRGLSRAHHSVGAYVSILGDESGDELADSWEALTSAGVASLHVYHFGLVPTERIAIVAAAHREYRDRTRRAERSARRQERL